MGGIIRNLGWSLIEIGGMPDHIHLLTTMRNVDNFSSSIQKIKSDSSKWIKTKDFSQNGKNFKWQEGYGAFTVSRSMTDTVQEYIKNQEEHHAGRSFEEEYTGLLGKHGIEYDPRFVLD